MSKTSKEPVDTVEQVLRPSDRRAGQDEVLIAALASGKTYREAGLAGGRSERTVRRRFADPEFAAKVARVRAEYIGTVTGALLNSASRAVEVLLECLDSERPSDRIRAAEMTLTLGRRFQDTNTSDREARLVALEIAAGLTEAAGEVRND